MDKQDVTADILNMYDVMTLEQQEKVRDYLDISQDCTKMGRSA